MELTFLVGKDGRNIKRAHSRRACTPCRQKKKRCFHDRPVSPERPQERVHAVDRTESPSRRIAGSTSPTSHGLERRSTSPFRDVEKQRSQSIASTSNARAAPVGKGLEARRFACDTNPLVTLLDDPQSRLLKGQARKGDVGAWLHDELNGPRRLHAPAKEHAPYQNGNFQLLPPKSSQAGLIKIYFCRIHPLLPLLDQNDTLSHFASGTLSLPLLQSICLVAAKDRDAASFLSLRSDETLLSVEKFSQRIYNDIVKNMPTREEKNRVTAIQILTLLSLHEWGPNGSEDSSLMLSQAIHHAQTIGLHLRRPDNEISLKAKALFWSLWSLDKWNSAINGRPVFIHDCDLGQKVTDVIPLFNPPFRIWLLLADKLGQVIGSFRPMVDGTREQDPDLPSFEKIVETSEAWNTGPELLDSLELYHHAIVILSTHSTALQGRLHSQPSAICQSESILTIAALCRRKHMKDLLPIAISAYSLSLAFSITYRQLQKAKLPSNRLLASENLAVFHQSLRSLSSTWWLAAVMVHLGKHALEKTRPQAIHERPDISSARTNQSQEVARSRSSTIDRSNISNDHYTPQTDFSRLENLNTAQGNINTPGETFSGVAFSNVGHVFENYDLSSMEEGYFDTFFQNFLDVNFPTSLGEQCLGGYDLLV